MRLAVLSTWISLVMAVDFSRLIEPLPLDTYQLQLKQLLEKMLWSAQMECCLAIITDEVHYAIYDRTYFDAVNPQSKPHFFVRVNASEDLRHPSQQLELILRSVKASGCDLHVITLLNGGQVKQLVRFVYESRALNMQQKFVMLHDVRLYSEDMLHVWSVFVRTVFLKRNGNNSFGIYGIAYPGILSGILVVRQLEKWEAGKHLDGKQLFKDRTANLKSAEISVAVAEHVPMAHWNKSTNTYQGVEIEIMNALAKALNFQPLYYAFNGSELSSWEQSLQQNESHLETGLIGEVLHHAARFAIGDLHLFQSYVQHVELSRPHSVECLSFLTPESSADNSWQTFILPFSVGMWIGVLLSLFAVGSIFYVFSFLNALLSGSSQLVFFRCLRRRRDQQLDERTWHRLSFRLALARYRPTQELAARRDIFDDYSNCILLTYSMLLYVSLPRMPRNWPLRVLTGWYWVYCILLVATYRASFTAILANPADRVTIDTLQELILARITPTTTAAVHKQFFLDASDDLAQQLGARMELVEHSADLTDRIAKGRCAFYDNEFYLRYMRVADENLNVGSTGLHIMRECVVHMPVVLALEKNSPLKPHVDNIIQFLSEGGFISKWLQDAIKYLPAEELAPQEAVMNLEKFWSSFVALAIGYLVSICALVVEHWHFRYIVMQHPIYDVYNPSLYYKFKRLFPND